MRLVKLRMSLSCKFSIGLIRRIRPIRPINRGDRLSFTEPRRDKAMVTALIPRTGNSSKLRWATSPRIW